MRHYLQAAPLSIPNTITLSRSDRGFSSDANSSDVSPGSSSSSASYSTTLSGPQELRPASSTFLGSHLELSTPPSLSSRPLAMQTSQLLSALPRLNEFFTEEPEFEGPAPMFSNDPELEAMLSRSGALTSDDVIPDGFAALCPDRDLLVEAIRCSAVNPDFTHRTLVEALYTRISSASPNSRDSASGDDTLGSSTGTAGSSAVYWQGRQQVFYLLKQLMTHGRPTAMHLKDALRFLLNYPTLRSDQVSVILSYVVNHNQSSSDAGSNSLQPDSELMGLLLLAMCKTPDKTALPRVLEHAVQLGCVPRVVDFELALSLCADRSNRESAAYLLQSMSGLQLQPSTECYAQLLRALAISGTELVSRELELQWKQSAVNGEWICRV